MKNVYKVPEAVRFMFVTW